MDINDSFQKMKGVLADMQFQETFPNGLQGVGKLKKVPVRFDASHPAIELLKMKGFCIREIFSDEDLTERSGVDTVMKYFQATKPVIDDVNKAIEPVLCIT